MATGDPDPAALTRSIAHEFRRRLLGEMLPRISACLDRLGPAGVWQRPAPHCNSAGNLVLHLCGNATQWILATFGVVPDQRVRDEEFAATGGPSPAELKARLTAVWTRCCDTVDALPAAEWLRERTIQQRYRETGLTAVLHVLEHASGHAGQIYAWTKQATGQDLRFYDL
ncbi:MAG: DinB family protein [Planctomycetes bacterium]|nr:DinB family protein [Planctomycetota bacterium]